MKKEIIGKIVAALSILTSIGVIVLAALQIFDVWENAGKLYIPLAGLTLLCNAYLLWDKNRKAAYFEIGCAATIFIVAIILLIVG